MEADSREVQQLRKYNKQLEAQFESQMDIIIELKKRYLDLNAKVWECLISPVAIMVSAFRAPRTANRERALVGQVLDPLTIIMTRRGRRRRMTEYFRRRLLHKCISHPVIIPILPRLISSLNEKERYLCLEAYQ